MGVSNGGIVRFPHIIGQGWLQEAVDDGVKQEGVQHSLAVPNVEVIGTKLVDPWSLYTNSGARLMCHTAYIISSNIMTA